MIGRKVSHYEILEQIGRGGMGVVYKAQDLRLKRVVALKFLPSGFEEVERERFLREAQALARLDRHENICTVYDIDEVESDGEQQTFIAMQYLEGKSLKELLAGGALRVEEALRLTDQVGRGLSYAHREGILHRDI
ncbi:MAG TPA: serine/threonine-protein kinase, partial [Candidatus Krumholzibacterium sp.]|nr:serine/threonine-protein kinase [Candidatus Krumholzibacterium sp.]